MEKSTKKPVFSPKGCRNCRRCVKACPKGAIMSVGFLWHRHIKPLQEKCIGCNKCVMVCPRNCFRKGIG